MKPRTKIEHEVLNLSKNYVAPLRSEQSDYAKEKCFEKFAKSTTKGVITCLECGHQWTDTSKPKRLVCPECSAKMRVEVTRKLKWSDANYFGILDNVCGYQVLRTFYIERNLKSGKEAYYYICEIIQRFIINEKKEVIVARARNMSSYGAGWSWSSDMEIRKDRNYWGSQKHIVGLECICPGYQVSREIKRNGFKGECYGVDPFELFRRLLYDPKTETLLKTKQSSLLSRHIYRGDVSKFWRSVCICNRNKYIVKNAEMWIDYMSMLEREGKDILNAKYVCPKNLKKAHDDLSAKIQARRERARKERDRLKALGDEQALKELKSKYFGIMIVDEDIEVKVLDSIEAYMEEGKAMHHCVFSNEYYLKPDSLILSASIDGKRIETVEVSLKTFKVVQSRGVCNSNTEYHDKIVNIVNRELEKQIKNRLSA